MSVGTDNQNQPVTTAVRAFVAPVNRESGLPTLFDGSQANAFNLDHPPAPWLAVGRVENFRRSAADQAESVQAGTENAVVAQFRKKVESHVSFDLRSWGKLSMSLTSGGTHWNVLESVAGEAVSAQPILAGSTSTLLKIDQQAASRFAAGDLIAVDIDYMQHSGYVGSAIAAAYIAPGNATPPSADFIRCVTFNVATIAEVNGGDLHLEQPLPGGDPPSSAGIQKVVGFADREGGAFRQEWSALFFEETACGGRVCYYYPRLQSVSPGAERRSTILGEFQALLLQANMLALPSPDPLDGVGALWYRFYVPSGVAA